MSNDSGETVKPQAACVTAFGGSFSSVDLRIGIVVLTSHIKHVNVNNHNVICTLSLARVAKLLTRFPPPLTTQS